MLKMQTKENKTSGKKLIYDAILVLSLLLVGLSAFLIYKSCASEGVSVSVSVDGEEIAVYPLDVDARYAINRGTNTLVVKDGEAYMESASCPDKICVNYGKIRRVGESIICRPNKVVVTVR
jgi:hypothetical protein